MLLLEPFEYDRHVMRMQRIDRCPNASASTIMNRIVVYCIGTRLKTALYSVCVCTMSYTGK